MKIIAFYQKKEYIQLILNALVFMLNLFFLFNSLYYFFKKIYQNITINIPKKIKKLNINLYIIMLAALEFFSALIEILEETPSSSFSNNFNNKTTI